MTNSGSSATYWPNQLWVFWGGAEGRKTDFFCILYCMFLHVTNQYLVNIEHTTSCLLSSFVLDSRMPTSFLSGSVILHSSCCNFCKKKKRESCIENCLFLMVVMPRMLTPPWCEYTWFTDVQKWGRGNLGWPVSENCVLQKPVIPHGVKGRY